MSSTDSTDCIFCKIAKGQIPAPRIYEDDQFFCIRDIQPQAKVHLLVIPRAHIESMATAFPATGKQMTEAIGKLFEVATRVARQEGLLPDGFRLVLNTNGHGGQTVYHLHLHVLGGQPLRGGFA